MAREVGVHSWMAENSISIERGHLTIRGLVVDEFRFLLRHYSGEKVCSFEDLRAVSAMAEELSAAIKNDYELPEEVEMLGIDVGQARRNLDNLHHIIQTIRAYVLKCGEAGVDIMPLNPGAAGQQIIRLEK